MDALAIAINALKECAAEANVHLAALPDIDHPNGWREVATHRIDVARAALARIRTQTGGDD